MPRKKANQIPRYNRTVNTRLPSLLDFQVREECSRLDVPVSFFSRKALEFYLSHIRARRDVFDLPEIPTAPTAVAASQSAPLAA